MQRIKYFLSTAFKNKSTSGLTWLYFIVAFVEIIAEFFNDISFIWLTKPLIMPILMMLYWKTSKQRNFFFLTALLFSCLANICFINDELHYLIIGSFLFLIYRFIVIYIVINLVKFPGIIPMTIGSLPFLFVYLYFINLTFDTLGTGVYLFLMQGFFVIFLGGFTLGNYMLKPNKTNTLLLISTLFFAFTQFVLVVKQNYLSLNVFQPIAMTLFVIGQYILVIFLLLAEKKKIRYEIINSLKQNNS